MDTVERKGGLHGAILGLVRDPLKLRGALSAALLAGWGAGVYMPASDEIAAAARRIDAERERLELAKQIESLRGQIRRFERRLPEKGDRNESVQFLMGGLRQHPIKLISLDPQPPIDVGPYKAVSLRVTIEGPYVEAERFLRWLEATPRLLRVDQLRIAPRAADARKKKEGTAEPEVVEMQLLVIGVVG